MSSQGVASPPLSNGCGRQLQDRELNRDLTRRRAARPARSVPTKRTPLASPSVPRGTRGLYEREGDLDQVVDETVTIKQSAASKKSRSPDTSNPKGDIVILCSQGRECNQTDEDFRRANWKGLQRRLAREKSGCARCQKLRRNREEHGHKGRQVHLARSLVCAPKDSRKRNRQECTRQGYLNIKADRCLAVPFGIVTSWSHRGPTGVGGWVPQNFETSWSLRACAEVRSDSLARKLVGSFSFLNFCPPS